MVVRITAGTDHLRRGRLVRLQHLCQRRDRSEKGAARRGYSATCAGHQSSGISSGGPAATGWETNRNSRRAHRVRAKISLWKAS